MNRSNVVGDLLLVLGAHGQHLPLPVADDPAQPRDELQLVSLARETELLTTCSIRGVEESEVLRDSWVFGGTHVSIPEVSRKISEVGKIEFSFSSLGLHTSTVNFFRSRSSLLVDPLDNCLFRSTSSVVKLSSGSINKKLVFEQKLVSLWRINPIGLDSIII